MGLLCVYTWQELFPRKRKKVYTPSGNRRQVLPRRRNMKRYMEESWFRWQSVKNNGCGLVEWLKAGPTNIARRSTPILANGFQRRNFKNSGSVYNTVIEQFFRQVPEKDNPPLWQLAPWRALTPTKPCKVPLCSRCNSSAKEFVYLW